jgi:hypothetical protein
MKQIDQLEDPGLGGWIILKLIKKRRMAALCGLMLCRIGRDSWLL